MSKVRVSALTLSLDGFGAGPGQDLQHPMGVGADTLHQWMRKTKMFKEMLGEKGSTTDLDNELAEQSMRNIGAWIMGRNMFSPIRGKWPDDAWKGWWGDTPPYHTPVYVLTHHARKPIPMQGDTTFYFVTDGMESALKKAQEAAKDKDIRIGGGASTVRQYLQAGLIDEMHLVFSPVLLGSGEHLLAGINLPEMGYEITQTHSTPDAIHMILTKK